MASYLLHRTELTPEQTRVVELPAHQHRVVFGPPGSGKTQVLIHRAAHLRETLHLDPAKIRIFVYTNVLKYYIKAGIELVDLPLETVTTFDWWCGEFYRAHISRSLPWSQGGRGFDYDGIRNGVLAKLKSTKSLQHSLDCAMVDEGQDLSAEAYQILMLAARHLTVFADPRQQIFEGGATNDEILKALGLPRGSGSFLGAYRNSPDVAKLATYLMEESMRGEFLNQIKNHGVQRERPLLFEAAGYESELDRLAEVVKQRLVQNQRVVIIVPQVRHVHGFAEGLLKRGVTLEKAIPPRGKKNVPPDFESTAPKIATYHSAKGITCDAVLLPRLSESAFPRTRDALRRRVLFVGITRATQWVYLSTVTGTECAEIGLLRQAASFNDLVYQKEGQVQGARVAAEEPEEDTEDVGFL